MGNTSTQILDAAESMIRDGGYYGFSFRQIADQLEIKSASVHYHYPTKEALATAVAERFTARFVQALGDPTRKNPIKHYTTLFQGTIESDGRACLCGILAGEMGKLPESVRDLLCQFSDKNIAWLEEAFRTLNKDWTKQRCREAALALFSGLEGGLTFAALHGKPDYLKAVAKSLLNLTYAR